MVARAAAAGMVLESPEGPITAKEIAGVREAAAKIEPAASNVGNPWVYGHPGQGIEGLGLMVEATGDVPLLDQMIRLSDAALAERNDLAPAPVGQRVLWTGTVAPVWPNTANTGYSSTENGDIIGHIAYCALTILKQHDVWPKTVPDGDPHHYGATYLDRAHAYITRMDESCDHFMVPALISKAHGDREYYPTAKGYRSLDMKPHSNAGNVVPWNQQFMIDNGFQRLAECHQLLGDAPNRVAAYDHYVKVSLAWFLSSLQSHKGKHGTYVLWDYALNDSGHVEDSNHDDIDIEGLARAYYSGRYADILTPAVMQSFANTQVDVMSVGHNRFAGRVDGNEGAGHSSGTNYPRPNVLFILPFRPEAYPYFIAAETASHHIPGDFNVMTRVLWLKSRHP